MAQVDDYRNLLIRLQHPVYAKDFSGVINKDTPEHILLLHLFAKQLVILKSKIDDLELNSRPRTSKLSGLSKWENDYFGFTKPSRQIQERIDELLLWINGRIGMSLPDVKKAAISITGQEPMVILKVNKGGWVLNQATLGFTTIIGGADTTENRYTYLVKFKDVVSTTLLKTLDRELTRIEKGGSKHIISAPKVRWILEKSSLGVDTILRN